MTIRPTRRSLLTAAATMMAASTATAQTSPGTRPSPPIIVLTAHSAVHSLAIALTRGSDITVEAIQPTQLPASRLSAFLSGRGKETLARAASHADAVITLRSLWPEDPLYPHARRSNIRLIEIDATRPIDGLLPGIAISPPSDDTAIYTALGLSPMPASGEAMAPWLAPTSLGRMIDVLASDLARLDPISAQRIFDRAADMKRQLRSLKADADSTLAVTDNLTALALSPHFRYLANDLGIELPGSITAAPDEWTQQRCRMLSNWLEQNGVPVVLLDTEPGDILRAAIADAKARHIVLAAAPGEADDPVSCVDHNLTKLAHAFSLNRP